MVLKACLPYEYIIGSCHFIIMSSNIPFVPIFVLVAGLSVMNRVKARGKVCWNYNVPNVYIKDNKDIDVF